MRNILNNIRYEIVAKFSFYIAYLSLLFFLILEYFSYLNKN